MISYFIVFFSLIIILFPKKEGMKTAFAGLGKALLGPLCIAMAVMKVIKFIVRLFVWMI